MFALQVQGVVCLWQVWQLWWWSYCGSSVEQAKLSIATPTWAQTRLLLAPVALLFWLLAGVFVSCYAC